MDQFMEKLKRVMPAWLGTRATQVYVFFMLVIFPSFFTNRMFRLHLDKRDFLLCCSAIYLCVLFPLTMIALYDWGNDMCAPKKPNTIFTLILLSSVAISTAFTIMIPRRAFFEMSSRTVSGSCFLCCILIFFAVRRFGKADQFLLWTWIAGSSGLYLFGILCACGINVLHIQDGLASGQLGTYLTPLGNTNFNTSYVCLMLPPILVMYMICRKQLSRILCGINLYLGFLFIFFIRTDSSILAILFGFILFGYFALETDLWSIRYIQTVGIYLGAKLTILILLYLFPGKLLGFHGLSLLLLDDRLLIREFFCYLAFFMIWNWKKESLREKLAAARKPLVFIGAALTFCSMLCVIFANINAAKLPAESFWNHFVLKNSSFSYRGGVWIRTLSELKNESFARKLFGNGLSSFKTLLRITGSNLVEGVSFADPHNEILQMAADMGLLGLIGYLGLLFTSLIKGLRNWQINNLHIVTVLTLSIYMLQALVNAYAIFTLPLLMIFLGLVNSRSADEQ